MRQASPRLGVPSRDLARCQPTPHGSAFAASLVQECERPTAVCPWAQRTGGTRHRLMGNVAPAVSATEEGVGCDRLRPSPRLASHTAPGTVSSRSGSFHLHNTGARRSGQPARGAGRRTCAPLSPPPRHGGVAPSCPGMAISERAACPTPTRWGRSASPCPATAAGRCSTSRPGGGGAGLGGARPLHDLQPRAHRHHPAHPPGGPGRAGDGVDLTLQTAPQL